MTVLNINMKVVPKALLVLPNNNYDVVGIFRNYLQKLGDYGKFVHVVTVVPKDKGRMSKDYFNPIEEQIKNYCELNGITTIITSIPELLRNFIESSKAFALEKRIGEVISHDRYNYIPTINSLVLKFQPDKVKLLQKSMDTVVAHLSGDYVDSVTGFKDTFQVTHPKTIADAHTALKQLISEPLLTVDIESTGLNWTKDRLLTIAFSNSETSATVIDFENLGEKGFTLLKNFFIKYKGRSVFHNVVFDIPFLVYKLFMKDLDDHKGMVDGVNQFNLDDTIVMAYLCLNSIERPSLRLKDLAYAKYGAYDANIDQSKLECYPVDDVAYYNAMDTMATYYVYNKYSKLLVDEEQDELYRTYYLRAIPALIKMKMVGLSLDKDKVETAYDKLELIVNETLARLQEYSAVKELRQELNKRACQKYNDTHVKQKTPDDFNELFKPGSVQQKRILLFEIIGMHHTKTTSAGALSTDKEVMTELLSKANSEAKAILEDILAIAQANVVKNTFLKAFLEKSVMTPKGRFKLYGNFKLFGTASGRLSSSEPNLLNVPSTGNIYAGLIKECIVADEGYIVGMSDYSSLEDRILASLANCKNKIRVYTEHIDGHSLNAAAYFKDDLIDRGIEIDINDATSINTIKKLAPDLRQDSKPVTFSCA